MARLGPGERERALGTPRRLARKLGTELVLDITPEAVTVCQDGRLADGTPFAFAVRPAPSGCHHRAGGACVMG